MAQQSSKQSIDEQRSSSSDPQQQQQQQQPASMPTAPYPPMMSSRYPSAHVSTMRSSMTSSPQYSTGAPTGFSPHHGGGALLSEQPLRDERVDHQHQTPSGGSTSQQQNRRAQPVGPATTAIKSTSPSLSSQRCRVQFAHFNMVACINCADAALDASQVEASSSRIHRKLGPILLELRQLQFVGRGPELFTTRTMALSRGNPSLGSSVSSTCLDVSSVLPATTYASASNSRRPPPCATGLTTGALCIHSFGDNQDAEDDFVYTSQIEYFHTPRHHRPATAVSWRRHNSRHVAVGLVSSAMAVAAPMQTATRGRAPNNPALVGKPTGGGDREFCCFLWDIEHQTTGTRKTNTSPLFKLSHNAGVASLAWLLEGGQTLAVGGQQRSIQLYDLRVSGTSNATPPVSALCHNFGVHGIEVDPFRPHQFATFCRAAGEPVKVWDARRMESAVSEIKLGTSDDLLVSALRWSSRETGVLSVALDSVVQDYDTSSSRPVLTRVSRAKDAILDMALYPGSLPLDPSEVSPAVPVESRVKGVNQQFHYDVQHEPNDLELISELYTHRMLVVLEDRSVHDMAKHTIAPLAVSRRDGRVVHAMGKNLFLGSTRFGPSAMERAEAEPDEDVSATMMRRARCLHTVRYSMDTSSNIQMLAEEVGPDRDALLRLWTWIERIEGLINSSAFGGDEPNSATDPMDDGGVPWPTKGLDDTGIWSLLQMEKEISDLAEDSLVKSDSLPCDIYTSPARRAALTACGWTGRFNLSNVLSECEGLGEYERSAALAVFHGSLGSAVDALQRGADAIHSHLADKSLRNVPVTAPQYAETLQLVAMCIAGYGGVDSKSSAATVWRKACESLMQRPDLNSNSLRTSRTSYLRALLTFLVNTSTSRNFDDILSDNYLSLCDRAAFACRFLAHDPLKNYLEKCIKSCQGAGNVEGLVVTGIEKEGIKILQSYVDRTADVQTAALVTSRVILPSDWTTERRVCAEVLESYRTLLNTWQMWQSRAMFDVDRADLVRKIKIRQAKAQTGNARVTNFQSHRIQSARRQGSRQPDPDIIPSVPAQLDARCTYCSSSLGLKRLENHANQWLSKMKPVLSCCPSCQKPLPRCAICLLSLGCLNPYMELTRERDRSRPSRGANSLQSPDDLSSLANLPFAEWFTWCMTCKHGGHAHHLVGWFANHEVCPVSGCDCRCQFDGIQKLHRPALSKSNELSSKDVLAELIEADKE